MRGYIGWMPFPTQPTREALFVWTASIIATGVLGLLGMAVPFVQANLLGFVAALFLYFPIWILDRRGVPLDQYGLTVSPLWRGLGHAAFVTIVVFPPYLLGHRVFQTEVAGRTPAFEWARLDRFDRDLEGRPELSAPGLYVWTDDDRLSLFWLPPPTPSEVGPQVEIALAAGASPVTAKSLYGLALRPNGDLVYTGRPRTKPVGSAVTFAPAGASGVAIGLGGADGLTLRGTGTLLAGRYGVTIDLPHETHKSSWWWLTLFATQVILVALPEEWFYRGYLQARMEEGFARRWRILGADLGWGWLLSSALFALGHLVLDPRPERLAVFFPSLLFGWLRARTGSVLAGTLFHAACNVYAQVLGYMYIG